MFRHAWGRVNCDDGQSRISLDRLVYFTIFVSAFCQSAQRHRNRSSFRHQWGLCPFGFVIAVVRRPSVRYWRDAAIFRSYSFRDSDRSFVQHAVLSWHYGFTENQMFSFYAVVAAPLASRASAALVGCRLACCSTPDSVVGRQQGRPRSPAGLVENLSVRCRAFRAAREAHENIRTRVLPHPSG